MNKVKFLSVCVSASLLFSISAEKPSFSANKDVCQIQISKSYQTIDKLIEQRKYDEAINLSNEMLKQNPNNSEARTALANAYSAQYKLDAAYREYLKALSSNPKNAAAHNGLGMVFYRKTTSSDMDVIKNKEKYYELALKEFQAAISLDSQNSDSYNYTGEILQEMGRISEAEKYYKKAIDLNPDSALAVKNLGTTLFEKNQVDAAIELYKQSISLNKKNSSAYYHLGEAYISKGDYSKAINYLQTSLYLFGNSAPVHDMLGKAYELQGNETAALSEYKKASFIKPEYVKPYISIASIYQDRGDYELAISELRNAVTVNPNFLEGKMKIADVSLAAGKYDQAIKYYKELTDNPTYSKYALKGLAKSYFIKAQEVNSRASVVSETEYVDAENALRQAIASDPHDIQLYLAMLRVSRLSGNQFESQMYLSRILKESSSNPINHIIKGEALLAVQKYEDASNEFKVALNEVNGTNDLLYLGEIYIMNRQYEPARIAFNKVLQKETTNLKAIRSMELIQKNEEQAVAKMNIAMGFYNEKQMIAAIEAFRDCISLNPNLPKAQLFLAKAYENQKYFYNAVQHYKAYVSLTMPFSKEYNKYNKKINKLQDKLNNTENSGKQIKKYSRI